MRGLGGSLLVGLIALTTSAAPAQLGARQRAIAWLAYVRHGDVYVVDPARGTTIRLTHRREAQARWGPRAAGDLAVSPDGTRVAFTGSTRRGTAIFVRSIAAGGGSVNVTPWRGQKVSVSRIGLNPQWLDATHVVYTADQTGSKPFGIVMEVDLATGQFAPMAASAIPGGAEFANFNGARSRALAQAGVMEPLVIDSRFAAFQRFDHGAGCSATSDLVRGFGAGKRILTFTPTMDEEPHDLAPDGHVLALRAWISAGRHDGLCTYGNAYTLQQEVIAVAGAREVKVLTRFRPLRLRGDALAPPIDAAWSPDGKRLAYISPNGDLVVRFLPDGSQRVVADHVEALDW